MKRYGVGGNTANPRDYGETAVVGMKGEDSFRTRESEESESGGEDVANFVSKSCSNVVVVVRVGFESGDV